MQKQSFFAAVTASALIALAGCATDQSTRTGAASNDATLNHQVGEAIRTVPGVEPNDLTVSTSNGVVTLKGRTATQAGAQDAIEAARHVPGVKKVDYDISVDQH